MFSLKQKYYLKNLTFIFRLMQHVIFIFDESKLINTFLLVLLYTTNTNFPFHIKKNTNKTTHLI